jgi:hypothetical protein
MKFGGNISHGSKEDPQKNLKNFDQVLAEQERFLGFSKINFFLKIQLNFDK